MSPRFAYLLSLFAFGAAGLLRGVVDYASDGEAWAFVAVAGGGVILAAVGYNAVRPSSYDGPEEWGPLVYLMAAASALFVVGTVWQFV